MILVGTFHHQLDENGRFRVPIKFKKAFNIKDKKDKTEKSVDEEEKFPLIMKGTNDCLFMYPAEVAEKLFFEKFDGCSFTSEDDSEDMRKYTAFAELGEPDSQGRIMLSDTLRAMAGIEKEIVSVGVYNHIEIWSKEKWNEYLNKKSAAVKSETKAKE